MILLYNYSIRRQLFLEKDIESCMGSAFERIKNLKPTISPVDSKTNQPVQKSEVWRAGRRRMAQSFHQVIFIPVFEKITQ